MLLPPPPPGARVVGFTTYLPPSLEQDAPALGSALDALVRTLADGAAEHGYRLAGPAEQIVCVNVLGDLLDLSAVAVMQDRHIEIRVPDPRTPEPPHRWTVVTSAPVASIVAPAAT